MREYYYPYFKDEEMETERGQETGVRTQTETLLKSEIKSKVKILYDFSGMQLELEVTVFIYENVCPPPL